MDAVTLLGVLWSILVAVLIVGTPIVLTVAFALWLRATRADGVLTERKH